MKPGLQFLNRFLTLPCTKFGLFSEQLAHGAADADNAVIACPGAQHLPRTAAEIEYSVSRFQTQRRAESGKLFGRDRVVDAVSTLSDVEYAWYVQCGKIGKGYDAAAALRTRRRHL